jgi:hypothetical protein
MGKADDGGRIGYRQSPPAFSRRYDLCPGTALRFPMSVRNAASREITAPMPTFRCLSHSPPPQCCGRPSRVIACSQSRAELDHPPTLPPPQPPNWIRCPVTEVSLHELLQNVQGVLALSLEPTPPTPGAHRIGVAPQDLRGGHIVFLLFSSKLGFDTLSTLLITGRNNSTRALKTPCYFLHGRCKTFASCLGPKSDLVARAWSVVWQIPTESTSLVFLADP